MCSLTCRPSWGKSTSSKGRRQTRVLFSLVVVFIVLQASQSFVPYVIRTSTFRAFETPSLRLHQQLTQIEPIKNNDGGDIEIDKTLSKANNINNNTESFGTLHPRKNRKNDVEYVSGIFRKSRPSISKKIIESTVDDMLKPSIKSMGLFGETIEEELVDCSESILATSFQPSSSVVARLATSMNDFAIANLRLSVFSNFNPESRKIFCERSCQLLASRRRRGATCIIATREKNNDKSTKTIHRQEIGPIVGTAETSFHEFSGTLLGRSRPTGSILYVTEVAVDATQRRKGIAKLMMEAIDIFANTLEVETIYLHVDVTNLGAVNLYKRAGFRQLEPDNPIFLEFTTKLNLHDGATKGRNHYLMARDLRPPTWFELPEETQLLEEAGTVMSQQRTLGIDVMSTV